MIWNAFIWEKRSIAFVLSGGAINKLKLLSLALLHQQVIVLIHSIPAEKLVFPTTTTKNLKVDLVHFVLYTHKVQKVFFHSSASALQTPSLDKDIFCLSAVISSKLLKHLISSQLIIFPLFPLTLPALSTWLFYGHSNNAASTRSWPLLPLLLDWSCMFLNDRVQSRWTQMFQSVFSDWASATNRMFVRLDHIHKHLQRQGQTLRVSSLFMNNFNFHTYKLLQAVSIRVGQNSHVHLKTQQLVKSRFHTFVE